MATLPNTKVFDEVKQIFIAYLEKKSFRKTPERFAILEEIYSREGHCDVGVSIYLNEEQELPGEHGYRLQFIGYFG